MKYIIYYTNSKLYKNIYKFKGKNTILKNHVENILYKLSKQHKAIVIMIVYSSHKNI